MGKLIKDGVVYAGGPSSAKSIRYDNSTSKISATNVQGALNDLDSRIGEGGGVSLTWEEYNQLSEEEQENGLYYITDYDIEDMGSEAEFVGYDNTKSGLTSDTVQEAIDEIDMNVDNILNEITSLKEALDELRENGAGSYYIDDDGYFVLGNKSTIDSDGYIIL